MPPPTSRRAATIQSVAPPPSSRRVSPAAATAICVWFCWVLDLEMKGAAAGERPEEKEMDLLLSEIPQVKSPQGQRGGAGHAQCLGVHGATPHHGYAAPPEDSERAGDQSGGREGVEESGR